MAQKKQKSIGRTPTKADMKNLNENIARFERSGRYPEAARRLKKHKKDIIAKQKRTKVVSRIDKALAKNLKKTVKKRGAKKIAGKVLSKAIPGVGTAYMIHDIMRAASKKSCTKRGGKWVGSGIKARCQVVKKTKKGK